MNRFLIVPVALIAMGTVAQAADSWVSYQCRIFSGQGGTETIFGIDAVVPALPQVCTVGQTCGRCARALLRAGYTLDKAFEVTQNNSGYAGPYFVFIK